MDKKGQVTIFIVIAIIAAVIIILAFALKPKIIPSLEKQPYRNIAINIEDCLNNELRYEVVSVNFTTQPSLISAKDYLQKFMNNAAYECSLKEFENYNDLTILYDRSTISSEVFFLDENEEIVEDLNDIIKINVDIYYPITIKQSNREDTFSKFSAGVVL